MPPGQELFLVLTYFRTLCPMPPYKVIPKNRFSIKFKNVPSGAEKKITKNNNKKKPNCSNITAVSVLILKTKKRILEPSNGGIGMRLKKARMTLMIITTVNNSKRIEPPLPAISAAALEGLRALEIISFFTACGIKIKPAAMAATKAMMKLDSGPASATKAGPHF